jgi:phospholipase C
METILDAVFAYRGATNSGTKTPPNAFNATTISLLGSSKIKHVIILVQENRTLDNLFHGYPGADTASTGLTHTGQSVPLTPGHLEEAYDLGTRTQTLRPNTTAARTMGSTRFQRRRKPPRSRRISTCTNPTCSRTSISPKNLRSRADHMFASQNGPSFPGHEYLIAGQSAGADDDPNDVEPWGCDAPLGTTVPVYAANGSSTDVFPCFDYQTLGDLLDAAHQSWRYYATVGTRLTIEALPDPYDAVRHIRFGPDWSADTVRLQRRSSTIFKPAALQPYRG